MDANNEPIRRADVAVVGGGLAGFTAAALLARAGRSVVLIEQASKTGGRAATQVRDGVHFNLGPHALYRNGHAFRLLTELGVPFTGRYPAGGRTLAEVGGRLHRLPAGLGSLLTTRLLTLREKWRFTRLLSSLKRTDARQWDHVSVRDWVAGTGARGSLAGLLRALVRVSTYGDHPDTQSAGASIDQLCVSLAGGVWYLDGGWQTLIDGLRDVAVRHGAKVTVGRKVESIDADSGGVRLKLPGGTLEAGAAVLTAGPDEACDLLDLPEDAPLRSWAAKRRPARAATLDLALRRLPRPRNRFALGIDNPYYFSVHSGAARLGPEGVAVLHVMKYLGGGADRPAREVEAELESFADRVQPGWRDHVAARRFLPNLTVTHAAPLAAEWGTSGRPDAGVADRPNVFLAGDWVGPTGMLADASAASAEAAAKRVLALPRRQRSLSHVAG